MFTIIGKLNQRIVNAISRNNYLKIHENRLAEIKTEDSVLY